MAKIVGGILLIGFAWFMWLLKEDAEERTKNPAPKPSAFSAIY